MKKKLKESNDKFKKTYKRTFNTQAFDSVVYNMTKNTGLYFQGDFTSEERIYKYTFFLLEVCTKRKVQS